MDARPYLTRQIGELIEDTTLRVLGISGYGSDRAPIYRVKCEQCSSELSITQREVSLGTARCRGKCANAVTRHRGETFAEFLKAEREAQEIRERAAALPNLTPEQIASMRGVLG